MPGRRPLSLLVALLAPALPACLHVSTTQPVPREEAPKVVVKPDAKSVGSSRTDFAELPRVPGTVVKAHPQASPGPNASAGTSTAQKAPSDPAGPAHPAGGPMPQGEAPRLLPPIGSGGQQEPRLLLPNGPQGAAPPEPPLLAAVRAYSEGRPDRAIEIIRTLPQPNQEFLLAMLPVLARGATADLNNDTGTAGMLVDQLDAARTRLEARAALRVENVTFCKDVAGFGRFARQPANEPYRPNARAQFYLEVKNLGSRPSGEEFITHIHATVEVRDAHGRVVEQIDPDDYRRRIPAVRFDKRLVSHSPLHDFHVLYIFSAPPAPGVYTISAELRDAATGRTVRTPPAQFCVAGP
jgi:hypothetical protein